MHKFFRKIFIACVVICLPALVQINTCEAQIYCQDTLLINQYFPCVGPYNPVCACNGVTYRNECFARSKDGITGTVVNGICGEFDFDIVPIPPAQNNNILDFRIYVREPSNVEIYISDVYGLYVYRNTLRNIDTPGLPYYIPIDTTNYEEGVYIMFVVVNNRFLSKRFSVVN